MSSALDEVVGNCNQLSKGIKRKERGNIERYNKKPKLNDTESCNGSSSDSDNSPIKSRKKEKQKKISQKTNGFKEISSDNNSDSHAEHSGTVTKLKSSRPKLKNDDILALLNSSDSDVEGEGLSNKENVITQKKSKSKISIDANSDDEQIPNNKATMNKSCDSKGKETILDTQQIGGHSNNDHQVVASDDSFNGEKQDKSFYRKSKTLNKSHSKINKKSRLMINKDITSSDSDEPLRATNAIKETELLEDTGDSSTNSNTVKVLSKQKSSSSKSKKVHKSHNKFHESSDDDCSSDDTPLANTKSGQVVAHELKSEDSGSDSCSKGIKDKTHFSRLPNHNTQKVSSGSSDECNNSPGKLKLSIKNKKAARIRGSKSKPTFKIGGHNTTNVSTSDSSDDEPLSKVNEVPSKNCKSINSGEEIQTKAKGFKLKQVNNISDFSKRNHKKKEKSTEHKFKKSSSDSDTESRVATDIKQQRPSRVIQASQNSKSNMSSSEEELSDKELNLKSDVKHEVSSSESDSEEQKPRKNTKESKNYKSNVLSSEEETSDKELHSKADVKHEISSSEAGKGNSKMINTNIKEVFSESESNSSDNKSSDKRDKISKKCKQKNKNSSSSKSKISRPKAVARASTKKKVQNNEVPSEYCKSIHSSSETNSNSEDELSGTSEINSGEEMQTKTKGFKLKQDNNISDFSKRNHNKKKEKSTEHKFKKSSSDSDTESRVATDIKQQRPSKVKQASQNSKSNMLSSEEELSDKELNLKSDVKPKVSSSESDSEEQKPRKNTKKSENYKSNVSSSEEETSDKELHSKADVKHEISSSESDSDKSLVKKRPNENVGRDSSQNREQRKSKKAPEDDKRIINLKKYLHIAGIRPKNYSELWKGCRSNKARVAKLQELLEKNGLKGRPTIEKCKKLRKKIETKKEIAELDVGNIMDNGGIGRNRRCTRGVLGNNNSRLSAAAEEIAEGLKNRFNRIKALNSSGSESD